MDFNLIWLIVLFPFLGAFLIRLFGGWLIKRTLVHIIACSTIFLSFLFSVLAFIALKKLGSGESEALPLLQQMLFPWIKISNFVVNVRFVIDPLSSVMLLTISGVGFLIHLYSTGYMAHDEQYHRYFAYLNLFTAMMLVLVLADNLLLMFVGWEGVGLCSYLLIGFWFKDNKNASAGKKAFIVNRIGDFGFTIGIITLFWAIGNKTGVWTFTFSDIQANISSIQNLKIFGMDLLTFSAICLFVGATGKSAQIPLYIWLPDAMAGPTPVSALIHAATMVTSGVYMISRLNFLYDLAPIAMDIVAWVGVITAFYAGTIGIFQNDIKKVLAYSTISQLGYMFLGVGVGAYSAGLFHLMTHAFFKALLFLAAGSVIHALSNKQDMREMGGLRKHLPYTFMTFAAAYLAICGIFPFAGFFSKDEILWKAANHSFALWGVGLAGAAMTAFYMTRLLIMTFFGKERFDSHTREHLHESPFSMIGPLVILAILSIVGGWIGWPEFLLNGKNYFHHFTAPVFSHVREDILPHSYEYSLMFISVAVGLFGIGMGIFLYGVRKDLPEKIKNRFSTIHKVVYNKYFIDEIYGFIFVDGLLLASKVSALFDKYVIDGIVNGSAWFLKGLAYVDGTFDRFIVDGAVNGLADITIGFGKGIRKIQTGRVYNYLLIMIVGFLGILVSLYFF